MKVSSIYLGLAGVALASAVQAAPEVEIGAEYQVNIVHSDDGLNEPKDVEQTSLNLRTAKVSLRGKISDQITWNVLYKAKESDLERYWLTNKVADDLDVSVGKQKIKVYGLHRKLTGGITPIQGSYLGNNPLTDKTSLDVTYKLAGTISLQLVEDFSKCTASTTSRAGTDGAVTSTTTTSCTSWTDGSTTAPVQKQPAMVFEWYGSFGEFSPLLQYASYDLGKSNTASVGLRYKNESLDAYVDYTLDTRNAKSAKVNAEGFYVEEESKFTGMVVYAEYKVDTYSPYVHVSTLATDPYLAGTASEATKVSAEANASGSLSKNEMTYAVGTFFENWGAFYRPFVHVAIASGEFIDPTDDTKTTKEDRTRTDVVAGVVGKF